jgi:hypothetical protein
MNLPKSYIHHPVKRSGAEVSLLLTLLSFAASVTLTRSFLYLTGYPQIGGGGLHIAHVLWGGLILFIAALLPLIFANRWVYPLGAILSGIGVGLFIDEVGKFITQDNNYFYPPAAPIIYAFFLLIFMVYSQVRRQAPRNPRIELYQALDALEEVLDHDLDARERLELEARLQYVAQREDQPVYARLARELLEFLTQGQILLAPSMPSPWQRLREKFQAIESRYVTRTRFRAALAGGVGAMGLVAIANLGRTLISGFVPLLLERTVSGLVEVGVLGSPTTIYWFMGRVILEGAVGLMLIASAFLLAFGKERRGVWGSYYSLLLSLTTVNILLFYFEQFSTIATAVFQLALLLAVITYRRRFLPLLPPPIMGV